MICIRKITYILISVALITAQSCTSADKLFGNGGENGEENPTGVAGDWYLKEKISNIFYNDNVPLEVQNSIESAITRQDLFNLSSVLTLTPPSAMLITSVTDENSLVSGNYKITDNQMTMNFVGGLFSNGSVTGAYTQSDSTMTFSIDKDGLLAYMRYETEVTTGYVSQYVRLLNIYYNFSRTKTTANSLIDGTYNGTAIFSAADLGPINNYNIIVRSLSDNTLALTFDPFSYGGKSISLSNLTMHAETQGKVTTFSATNKVVNNGSDQITLTCLGTIKDKELDLPQMTIKLKDQPTLFFRFISKSTPANIY